MTPTSSAWSDVSPGVRVRQSRVYWMNSVVLLDREHTLIVDPGVLPSELDEIAREVGAFEPRRITLIMTHGDWDHVLGAPWWPAAAILAHDAMAAETRAKRERILESTRRAVEQEGE